MSVGGLGSHVFRETMRFLHSCFGPDDRLPCIPVLVLVLYFRCQMDPDNKPTREELKDEVIKVSKGLVGLGGFNLVSVVSKI